MVSEQDSAHQRLRIAGSAFAVFGVAVYGGFAVAGNGVPGWVQATYFVMAVAVLALAAIEVGKRPSIVRAAPALSIAAAVILLIAALALVAAALS